MRNIKILGPGCSKCTKTAQIIEKVAADCAIAISIVKEINPEVIMAHNVMCTPAIFIDEKMMHCGSIPRRKDIKQWLCNK